MTAEDVRNRRERVLLRLLARTQQIELAELVRRLAARGFGDVTPNHIGLLANVDTEGTRVSTVAGRLGTSRQAVSQLAGSIQALGYLERAVDPEDRRAILVRHTSRGRMLLMTALEEMADIEAGYAAVLGEERMELLRSALSDLADAIDPSSALAVR